MKAQRRTFIVGGHITPFIGKFHPDFIWKKHPDFGTRENPTIEEHLTTAILGALEDAKTPAAMIEKGYVGNFAGGLFVNQLHMGSMAARAHPDLDGKPFARLEGACASGGLAVVSALESIQAGYDVVMAAGAEVQTTYNAQHGAEFLARASHYETERSLDKSFAFPAMFARRAKEYCEKYNLPRDVFTDVVLKAYHNGNRNPLAHMHAVQVNHEEASTVNSRNGLFLSNEAYRDWLRVLECSPVSDGGAAIVLASEEGLKRIGVSPDDCVEIISVSQRTGALGLTSNMVALEQVRATVETLWSDTGLKLSDVNVAEVHDCFAVAEVMMMEAIGLAGEGEGIKPISEGRTAIDGDLPVNTGGGLIAFGHPIGATGIKQVFEVVRQMRGACGDYQVPGSPRIGMTVNMGGDDRTIVATLLRQAGS